MAELSVYVLEYGFISSWIHSHKALPIYVIERKKIDVNKTCKLLITKKQTRTLRVLKYNLYLIFYLASKTYKHPPRISSIHNNSKQ